MTLIRKLTVREPIILMNFKYYHLVAHLFEKFSQNVDETMSTNYISSLVFNKMGGMVML